MSRLGSHITSKKAGDCTDLHSRLQYDEACFSIFSSALDNVTTWMQLEECFMCDLMPEATIPPEGNATLLITSKFPVRLSFKYHERFYCNQTYHFGENGFYNISINGTSCSEISVVKEPINTYLPIAVAFVVYISIALLYNFFRVTYKSKWLTRVISRKDSVSKMKNDLENPEVADGDILVRLESVGPIRRQNTRFKSLDTFRGMCLTIMIFVNYGGGRYYFFQHCTWNGLTIADLVFPWFLWIVGVCTAISLRAQLQSLTPRRQIFLRVLKRSVILVVLGLLLKTRGYVTFRKLILPGVLQQIGLSYLVVALLETFFMKRQEEFQHSSMPLFRDITDCWFQWIFMLLVIITHTTVTFLLAVPGCPKGYLGPGGLHKFSQYVDCTGGAASYIDRIVLGSSHYSQAYAVAHIYHTTVAYNNYGVLCTLTSIFLVFLGVQAGRILLMYHNQRARISRLIIWSLVTGLIAGCLCGFSKEDGVIPVNKRLFSLSFVLTIASMAFFLQCVLHVVVDVKNWWDGNPFNFVGMNSILLYLGHTLLSGIFPLAWAPTSRTHAEYLTMNLVGTTTWIIISYILYKKNIFLKI